MLTCCTFFPFNDILSLNSTKRICQCWPCSLLSNHRLNGAYPTQSHLWVQANRIGLPCATDASMQYLLHLLYCKIIKFYRGTTRVGKVRRRSHGHSTAIPLSLNLHAATHSNFSMLSIMSSSVTCSQFVGGVSSPSYESSSSDQSPIWSHRLVCSEYLP